MFDDTTAHNSDSNSAVATEAEPTMEHHQPEQNSSSAADQPVAAQSAPAEEKAPASEDFASALETFTTEAEEAVSEDRVIKGTVLKLTGTHVVVDIGAKSEGMLAAL